MMRHQLSGDGIHDDTAAIQELLDSRNSCVFLPPPKVCYLISRTLKIHSFQELKLDRWTTVKLAARSNCPMITNDDHQGGNRAIALTGGIWDGNNREQSPNPQMMVDAPELPPPIENREKKGNCPSGADVNRLAIPADYPADPVAGKPLSWKQANQLPYHPDRYYGVLSRFVNVDGFSMQAMTFRNPVSYATQFGSLRNFTITHIVFDFNEGNPSPNNMDGLHFDGFCRNGYIADLKGACYDDLLAFNAEDGTCDSPGFGPIENIVVDGIFADRCHSAARLLSCGSEIRNITIRNVYGSFYRYAVGMTHFFPERPARGRFDGIVLENLHISKALPLPSDWNRCPDWGLIWGEGSGRVGTLKVTGLHRVEETTGTPCFEFEAPFEIDSLTIEDCSVENRLEQELELLHNDGTIHELRLGGRRTVSAPGAGTVREITGSGRILRQSATGQ